jgi:transposase
LRYVFLDGGYAGDKLRAALEHLDDRTVNIVERSDTAKGFALVLRRQVIARIFPWPRISRRRARARPLDSTSPASS